MSDFLGDREKPKPLGVIGLVALIFFSVAGSPAGIEDAIAGAGPLYALVGLLVMPLVWSIPEAFISAELSSAFPDNAGYVGWVSEAFGETAGFVEGFMSWLSGVTDNTIYPIIIVKYFSSIPAFGLDEDSTAYYGVLIGMILVMSVVNWTGLRIVGAGSIALVILSLAPFIIMVLLGTPHVKPERWLATIPAKSVDWGMFLNTLFWNLNYFDSVTTLAGEVKDPAKTFPKAMLIAVVLTVLMYLLSVAVGVGVSAEGTTWDDSFFSNVALQVGGKWLQYLVIGATTVSCIGQFLAEQSTDAFELCGMAERRMLPKCFARRSRFDTPTLAMLVGLAVTLPCALLKMQDVIEMLNILYIYGALLEFAAFLYLRFKRPLLPRPFRAPLSNIGAIVMLIPTFVFTLIVFFFSSWQSHVIAAAALIISACMSKCLQALRSNETWTQMLFLPAADDSFLEPLLSSNTVNFTFNNNHDNTTTNNNTNKDNSNNSSNNNYRTSINNDPTGNDSVTGVRVRSKNKPNFSIITNTDTPNENFTNSFNKNNNNNNTNNTTNNNNNNNNNNSIQERTRPDFGDDDDNDDDGGGGGGVSSHIIIDRPPSCRTNQHLQSL